MLTSDPQPAPPCRQERAMRFWGLTTCAAAALMLLANLHVSQKRIYLGYNSGDYFEWGDRVSAGWPLSLAHFEPATARWVVHPFRLLIDGAIAAALTLTACLVLGGVAAKMARRPRPDSPGHPANSAD